MTTERRQLGSLDFELFAQRLDGDPALMQEMARLYLGDYSRQLNNVRLAMDAGNPDLLRLAAHTVRGTAINFAASPVMRAAQVLEAMGKSGNLTGVDEAFSVLDAELHRLRLALEAFLINT